MDRKEFQEKINAFRGSRVLLTAFELGLFSAVADCGSTSADVARRAGTDPRATERILNVLCALRLLKKSGERFRHTPFSSRHLVSGRPGYLAGLAHSVRLFDNWSRLTEVVRKGKPETERQRRKTSREWREGFIAAMHERASEQAGRIVRMLDLRGVTRMLDVGGGSGAFSSAMMRAKDDLKATIIDLPEVIPITRRYVGQAGFLRRTAFISGDFNRDPLAGPYDLVLLSAVIHMQSLAKNERLFARIFASLAPAGQMVIQDYIMDKARLRPEAGAFFAINMLVNTEDGDTFTAAEVKSALRRAGFVDVVIRPTPFPAALAIGRKPGL